MKISRIRILTLKFTDYRNLGVFLALTLNSLLGAAQSDYVVQCEGQVSYPVHLTFDDGPVPGRTEAILEILKRYNIQATFFLTTSRLAFALQKNDSSQFSKSQAASVALIHRMLQEGHKVGSHSFEHINHLAVNEMSDQQIYDNLNKSMVIWDSLNLPKPAPFRFPYGSGWIKVSEQKETNEHYINVLHNLHQTLKKNNFYLAHWDVDSWDWSKDKRDEALGAALQKQVCSHQGGVVLMHDLQKYTVAHLERQIQLLLQAGHYFVSHDWMLSHQPERYAFKPRAVSSHFCQRPSSDFDQVWGSCEEYRQHSSDIHQEYFKMRPAPTNLGQEKLVNPKPRADEKPQQALP